jgi:Rod binding domain-containing protein
MTDTSVPAAAQVALAQAGAQAGTPGGLRQAAGTSDPARAREAAEQFEAVFLSQMLEPMFAGLDTSGPFGGGQGEKVFRSLMIQEYGRLISRTGGVGIADHVMAEILRVQEAANEGTG